MNHVRAIANGALVLTAMVWVLGCSNKSSSGDDCETGSERCACYGNKSCDKGLECLSDICVSVDGAGGASGGAGGDGGKNAGGDGDSEKGGKSSNNGGAGDSNEGGHASVGEGGKTSATGGKSSAAGGNTATGGSTAVGGSAAAGGTSSVGTTSATNSANLIKNGDFGLGKEYWDLTYNDGDIGASSYSSGKYCIMNPSSSYYLAFSLGYPPTPSDAFVIEPGVTYKISYYLSGSGLSSVTTKIGHAVSPYTPVYQVTDSASSLGSVKSHTFSTAAGDTAAGLVFNGTLDYGAEVCFDDIIVEKN
jgi:hypothetical protein